MEAGDQSAGKRKPSHDRAPHEHVVSIANAEESNAIELSAYPLICATKQKIAGLPIRLIPIETVCEILGFKRSATLEMVAKRILPQPLKFGTSRRAAARWLEHEIYEFIMKKAAERKFANSPSDHLEVDR